MVKLSYNESIMFNERSNVYLYDSKMVNTSLMQEYKVCYSKQIPSDEVPTTSKSTNDKQGDWLKASYEPNEFSIKNI